MLDFFKILKNTWFDRNTSSLDEKFFTQDYKAELGEFAPYYVQHIRPLVKDFEAQRLRRLSHLTMCRLVAFILIAITFYAHFWKIGFVLILMPYIPIYLYSYAIEKDVFPLIFRYFDEKAAYKVRGTFKDSYKEFGIAPHYNEANIGTYVALDYKEVHIELLETELIYATGSGRDESTKTVFKGLTVILNMNKPFKGKTLVKKDPGAFGKLFEKPPAGLENIKLEDPVFEKQFEVYASDQIEARYILTPSFMENLLKISKSLGNKGVQCSFFNDKLFMMFDLDYEYFAPSSLFNPATFIETSQNIIAHMNAIFSMINILKLYQHTKL